MTYKIRVLVLAFLATVLVGSFLASSNFRKPDLSQGSIYHVYLDYELETPQQSRDIVRILQFARKGDTVVIHMTGPGGDMESMDYIISNIKSSLAHTVASVEGNVYSAHAFIAVSTDELRMAKDTFLMFHTFSGYGFDCGNVKGLDRTRDARLKCQQLLDMYQKKSDLIISQIRILTPAEKEYIATGYDVYLPDSEVNKRLVDMNLATQYQFVYVYIPEVNLEKLI